MKKFSILSPAMGEREDYPSILLRNAFMPDNENVQMRDGEVISANMRVKELVRKRYVLTAVDTVNKKYTFAGTHSQEFATGDTVVVVESTGNDSNYTVASCAEVSGDTVITVSEVVPDTTVDGYLYNNVNTNSTLKVVTPDGNPIIKYFNHTSESQTEYLLCFTKDHVYRWDTSLTKWIVMWTNTGSCTSWSVDAINSGVVATNNVDYPLWWDGNTANVFEGLDDTTHGPEVGSGVYISQAKAVIVYENYVILGNVTLSNGESYPEYIFWCDTGDQTAWMTGDAGNAYVSGLGTVECFGVKFDLLYIFKSRSTRKYWYTGTSLIWANDSHSEIVGCNAMDSVVNDSDGNLYYFASDFTFREINGGKISHAKDKTIRSINPASDYVKNIRGTYIVEYGEVWWAVPIGNSTVNDKVLCYKEGKWCDRAMTIYAFGHYNRKATWTWDTLPYDSWEEWSWDSWDSVEGTEGYPTDLCSDANGYTYASHLSTKDDGEDFTAYFVLSTDLADTQSLGYYKRLLHIRPYLFSAGANNITVYIKRDNEANWQEAGSVSMDGTAEIIVEHLAVSYRFKHALFKFASTSPFRFIGVEFDYVEAGRR